LAPRIAAIALGSNDGDRAGHLDYAVDRLVQSGALDGVAVSAYYQTDPAPPAAPDSPLYLNAALVGRTGLSARTLVSHLLVIERDRGRERPFRGAPRPLDLDLILLGEVVLDEPGVQVPHPRFRERRFVLEPLAAIAPNLVDPVTGMTVGELWGRVR
jgi:2-amino-4-hydroxy-6-hydroxymethyldihydropteridine diphosphokinase